VWQTVIGRDDGWQKDSGDDGDFDEAELFCNWLAQIDVIRFDFGEPRHVKIRHLAATKSSSRFTANLVSRSPQHRVAHPSQSSKVCIALLVNNDIVFVFHLRSRRLVSLRIYFCYESDGVRRPSTVRNGSNGELVPGRHRFLSKKTCKFLRAMFYRIRF
jgi:hypothetical protein